MGLCGPRRVERSKCSSILALLCGIPVVNTRENWRKYLLWMCILSYCHVLSGRCIPDSVLFPEISRTGKGDLTLSLIYYEALKTQPSQFYLIDSVGFKLTTYVLCRVREIVCLDTETADYD